MVRTQIHLTVNDLALLDEAERATGATRSELIRRAIRDRYGVGADRSLQQRRAAFLSAAGVWKDRAFTGEDYVRAIRSGDMNANLRRLGVD